MPSEPARDLPLLATDALARASVDPGNAAARQQLFDRIAPAVYAWVALHLRGPLRRQFDVEDVVQEITLRALQSFPSWRSERGTFRQFYFGIAKHVLGMALRRSSRDPVVQRPDPSGDAAMTAHADFATTLTRAAARDDSLLRLIALLDELPDDDRRLALHRGLEGLGHDDVAKIFRVSVDAIHKRWQRLCDRLRENTLWRALAEA